jgi:hypothetical protein
MKKKNAKISQRRLGKDLKNKARLKRAQKKREWHHMVAQVKFMQEHIKKAQEANESQSKET